MPKYRKLHACTLDSLDLAAMPDDFTRLMWLMFPLILSRDGTTLDHPHYLRSKLFPLRSDVSEEMISAALDWFIERGMVKRYKADERGYLYFPTFSKYQGDTKREAESTFPPPPAELVNPDCTTNSRPTHEPVTTNSRSQVDAQVDAQVEVDADARAHEQRAPDPPPPPEYDPKTPLHMQDDKTPVQIRVFREASGIVGPGPSTPAWDEIVNTVVDAPVDLKTWGDAVREWSLRGFKMRNVAGMLDWYKHGIPPRGSPREVQAQMDAERAEAEDAAQLKRKLEEYQKRVRYD